MIVEVVTREVGKDRNVERDSVNPLLFQRVRGNFHYGFRRPLAQGLVQNPVQLQRFGSRVRRRKSFSGDVIFDGPDQRALASRGGQDGFDQERSGAFSIRTSDAGDSEALGGLLVKVGTKPRQRPASVRHLRPGNLRAGLLGRRIGNDGNCTRRDSLVDEFVSITRFTLHGDKGIAGLDLARVIFQPADPGVAALGKHFRAVQEFEESH